MGEGRTQNFDAAFFNKYATSEYLINNCTYMYDDWGYHLCVWGPIQWNHMQLAIKKTTYFASGKVTEEVKKDIEAKKDIFASIEHKHLMRIHFADLSQLPKATIIVTDFAAGGSLRKALWSLKLPNDVVTDWAKQIAEGMLYLHEKNVVHTDLNSSNILLMEPFDIRKARKKMTLKIKYFDRVKAHDHTVTMSFVGTFDAIAYKAPEVIKEQRFSKGSDVWSYGVVIWEMLKGNLKKLKIEELFDQFWKPLLRRCMEPMPTQRASFHDVVSTLQFMWYFDQDFLNKYATLPYFWSRGANGSIYGPIQWNGMQLAIKQTTFAAGKVTEEVKKHIEAKKYILASIEHEHLMRFLSFDLSQLPKSMFIVMEFAAGGSLHEALRSSGGSGQKLPIDVVTDWAKQIAEGMLNLHEKHIVHRDLKSSNILLMEPFNIRKPRIKMTLKIADFDEIKDHDHATAMSFVRTVAYMAPEVIVEERFSKGSDVWSYGVVIWEMLTGDTPHKGLEPNTIIHQAVTGELANLKIEESFGQFWKPLLRRCMEPMPAQRASFHDVVFTLQGMWYIDQDFLNKYATMPYFLGRGTNGSIYGPIQWNDMQMAFKQTKFAAGKVTDELKKDIEVKKGILASIVHEHVLKIHSFDLSRLPKSIFIVMEFAAGGSLHEALRSLKRSGEKLPSNVVTDWAKQIAEGMLYLHEKDIVHRDLKSSNILLMEPFDFRKPHTKMTLKIADFDKVKYHDHTVTMSSVRTVAYMEPEVIKEQRFSKDSDVWSYGVVLWEMLAGDTPHKGLDPKTIIHKAITGELDNLKMEESFPQFWKQILKGCLKTNTFFMQGPSFRDMVSILQAITKYNCDPVLINTIKSKAAEETGKSITGLAILDNELFVVTGGSSDIDVYDSVELSFSRRMNLKELIYPVDITSCNKSKCLYILDAKGFPKSDEILRVDSNAKLIKNWSIGYCTGYAVSITDESNVIVSVHYWLKEYSPDGQLIKNIRLLAGKNSLLNSPTQTYYPIQHAIKFSCSSGSKPIKHGVWIMCEYERLIELLGVRRGGPNIEQMEYPFLLLVDVNGNVLVIDVGNSRVLLLWFDSYVRFKIEILSKEKHGLLHPWRIMLDETNGRMLVADSSGILIFQLRE